MYRHIGKLCRPCRRDLKITLHSNTMSCSRLLATFVSLSLSLSPSPLRELARCAAPRLPWIGNPTDRERGCVSYQGCPLPSEREVALSTSAACHREARGLSTVLAEEGQAVSPFTSGYPCFGMSTMQRPFIGPSHHLLQFFCRAASLKRRGAAGRASTCPLVSLPLFLSFFISSFLTS